ncbi:MAG: hypothetical protein AVDCRST_MAG93-5817, partial [uncultured Chloroflexia bacterium]
VMMGRDGNWTIALYTFVALVVWLGVAALCSAGIIIARIAHLVR